MNKHNLANKNKFNNIIALIFILLFFLLTSYLVQTNLDFVKKNLDYEIYGILLYVFITIYHFCYKISEINCYIN